MADTGKGASVKRGTMLNQLVKGICETGMLRRANAKGGRGGHCLTIGTEQSEPTNGRAVPSCVVWSRSTSVLDMGSRRAQYPLCRNKAKP